MKKVFLGLTIIATLFSVSCKKSSSNSTPPNSMTIGGTVSTPVSVNFSTNSLASISGFDASTNGITVLFSNANKPSAGTYSVKTVASSSSNQVNIIAVKSATTYVSKDGSQSVSVSLPNSKVSVSGTDIWMYNSSNILDSIKISFTLTQG